MSQQSGSYNHAQHINPLDIHAFDGAEFAFNLRMCIRKSNSPHTQIATYTGST